MKICETEDGWVASGTIELTGTTIVILSKPMPTSDLAWAAWVIEADRLTRELISQKELPLN